MKSMLNLQPGDYIRIDTEADFRPVTEVYTDAHGTVDAVHCGNTFVCVTRIAEVAS